MSGIFSKEKRNNNIRKRKRSTPSKNLSIRKIYDLYWKEKKSTRDVAKILNVSQSTLLNFMKKVGIQRRKCGRYPKVIINPETLFDLYWNKRKSTIEIAKLFGINRATVFYHFKKNKLPLRNRLKAVSESAHKRAIYHKFPFSGNELEKEYLLGFSEDLSFEERSKWQILVTLTTANPNMINLFIDCFKSYGRILKYPVKITNEYYWRLCAYLDKSFSFLLKPNRNYDFENMDEEKFYARLAGVIDAEGSIVITKSKKYISRAIVIGSETEDLIEGLLRKLVQLGFHPNKYLGKRRNEIGYFKDIILQYNQNLWFLTLNRKDEIVKILGKVPLKNGDRIKKKNLIFETINAKYWFEVKNKVKSIRSEIKNKIKEWKEKAKIEYLTTH
jgi:DNA-binding CsgD family transcriptional regulator